MEGQEFVVINPDTLNNKDYFSYRDLQKLCLKLNLGGSGNRELLELKLKDWNRQRSRYGETVAISADENENDQNIPMNVIGNNFSLLAVNIVSKTDSVKSKKTSSIAGFSSTTEESVVSPTLLRALRAEPSTPGKGILKQHKNSTPHKEDNNSNNNISITRFDKITFSPFNGVKVIPNRRFQHNDNNDENWGESVYNGYEECEDDENNYDNYYYEDENSEEEEEEEKLKL